MTFWTGARGEYMGWRLSLAIQFIPAFIFGVGLPFLPETLVPPYPFLAAAANVSRQAAMAR